MANPPKSPPSKELEGRDRGKPSQAPHTRQAAEQEARAADEGKGRPPQSNR